MQQAAVLAIAVSSFVLFASVAEANPGDGLRRIEKVKTATANMAALELDLDMLKEIAHAKTPQATVSGGGCVFLKYELDGTLVTLTIRVPTAGTALVPLGFKPKPKDVLSLYTLSGLEVTGTQEAVAAATKKKPLMALPCEEEPPDGPLIPPKK